MSNTRCNRNQRLSFVELNEKDFSNFAIDSKVLDALFIPTCRTSSVLPNRLDELADTADQIFLLPSREASKTLEQFKNLPDNVMVLTHFLTESNRNWFMSLRSSNNPTKQILLDYDLPLKRNLALHISKLRRYKRVGFLDDDITISSHQVRAATAALGNEFPMAGFYVLDYPDISTSQHIARHLLGDLSETIPGGNCLFFIPDRIHGFFPYIYNEDWMFILENLRTQRFAVLGEVRQEEHSPWRNPNRVAFEEFGDLVITGILESIEAGGSMYPESYSFWKTQHETRMQWLSELRMKCGEQEFMPAICAAINQLEQIKPEQCTEFIFSLQCDIKGSIWKTLNVASILQPQMELR